MRASLTTCSWRSAVAVLASGAVISLSALSGGVAPAFAKPDKNDPGIPIIPTPEVVVPEAPQAEPEQRAPAERRREQQQPPQVVEAPPVQPAAPPVQAPAPPAPAPAPQVQEPAPEPAPQIQAPAPQMQAPAPQMQAPAPEPKKPAPQIAAPAPKKEQPQVVEAPKADPPKVDTPKVDTPKVDTPKIDTPKGDPPTAELPAVDAPKASAPKAEIPTADAPNIDGPTAEIPAVNAPNVSPPAKPDDPKQDQPGPRNLAPGANKNTSTDNRPVKEAELPKTDPTDPSEVSKAAQRVTMAAPDKLEAPEQDIQLARQAKPVEVKPEPAKRDDVDFLSSALNIESKTKLGPFESEFNVGSEFSIGGRDRDRDWDRDRDRDHDWDWDKKHWDKKVRQWDRRWIEYDDWYRPVFFNPFRAPVRIVYLYERAPRIVYLPPLARVVVDAAAVAAYSFTAVVLNAANLAADVAVGTFFGGGFIPPIGAPFVPPPPLARYDNVPVQVRYSNATYQPFRVNQIVDVGDDVQYGGRKVLLDGATPAWGQWTTSPTGERQFEVHRTQQYPGLGEPQEAPLPGDYRMQLASDESASDRTQMYLVAAGGVVGGLGLGALGLALYLGRRRLKV